MKTAIAASIPAQTRRTFVLGSTAAIVTLVSAPVLAAPEKMATAIKEAFGDTPIQEGKVAVTLPDITENGRSVSALYRGRLRA